MDSAAAVSFNYLSAIAIKTDGSLWFWWHDSNGSRHQLANGELLIPAQYYASPTKVVLPENTETPKTGGAPTTEIPPIDSASSWARDGITNAVSKGFVPSDLQNNYTNVITRAEFCRMAVKWVEYKTGKSIDTVLAEKGVSRNPTAFSDTTDEYILAAYALGITSGTGSGKFTPNGQFNREQAAGMIRNTCKAAGLDVSNVAASGFADIGSASSWAVDGINFVNNAGIMSGTGSGNFSPKATYTREQSIVTFNNIAK